MTGDLTQQHKWRDDVIGVVVCDDFAMARRRLVVALEEQGDMDVAAEAADGESCIEVCASVVPDVVIIGMAVERIGGPATAAGVRAVAPSTRVIMVATAVDDHDTLQAVMAGATGFVSREMLEQAPAVVRAVAAGVAALPPLVARRLIEAYDEMAGDAAAPRLDARERQVLDRLARGTSYVDLARDLEIAVHTGKNLATNSVEKLQRHVRVQAVLTAAGDHGVGRAVR